MAKDHGATAVPPKKKKGESLLEMNGWSPLVVTKWRPENTRILRSNAGPHKTLLEKPTLQA